MSESPALPYLDVEKLSRECTQTIEKHFRRLRYAWVWPHSRATLTLFEDRFQLDFPDSRTLVECAIDPDVGAWVILEHLAVLNSRLLLWGKMPSAHFLDLLEAMRGCGFAVVCCHENHAILQLPKENTMDISEGRRMGRNRQRELLRERETELNGLVGSLDRPDFCGSSAAT